MNVAIKRRSRTLDQVRAVPAPKAPGVDPNKSPKDSDNTTWRASRASVLAPKAPVRKRARTQQKHKGRMSADGATGAGTEGAGPTAQKPILLACPIVEVREPAPKAPGFRMITAFVVAAHVSSARTTT